MNYLRILGLMAVAAATLMAFAASASATTLTSPTGTTYTGTFAAHSTNFTTHGSFVTVSCTESKLEGKVEQHGAGKTVKGNLTKLTFSGCNFPFTVNASGNLEFHAVSEITNVGTGKKEIVTCNTAGQVECTGTVTSNQIKLTVATSVGNCVFTTNATDLGTLTPTNDTLSTAVLDIGAPEGKTGRIPRTEGNFLCGSSAQWTGSYSFTTPDSLYVDG
jgi:hypothetical protein